METQPVILFDGVCNFCNGAVNFVIKRDKRSRIRFATMQSDAARELLAPYHWPVDDMKSFLFIENGKLYDRSTAALRVCRYLRGGWPLCYGLIIVPKFIRDGIYNWVARNRYKWFGQKDQCMVPTPDVRARFLNG